MDTGKHSPTKMDNRGKHLCQQKWKIELNTIQHKWTKTW